MNWERLPNEDYGCDLYRMPVPGGWLYRLDRYNRKEVDGDPAMPTAVSITFVPRQPGEGSTYGDPH